MTPTRFVYNDSVNFEPFDAYSGGTGGFETTEGVLYTNNEPFDAYKLHKFFTHDLFHQY